MAKRKLNQFQKILKLMVKGNPVFKKDLSTIFGEDFLMYKLSCYILNIKQMTGSAVRVVKDGRTVVSYQLMEPHKGIDYLKKIDKYDIVVPEIEKLSDLNAKKVEDKQLIEHVYGVIL